MLIVKLLEQWAAGSWSIHSFATTPGKKEAQAYGHG